MKETLKREIEGILESWGVENPKVNFDVPTHTRLGDSTTNVAMAYAKELQKKPVDLASEIKEALIAKSIDHISRIDVIAPGFINFFFDEHYFNKSVFKGFEKGKIFAGQNVIIEYTDPNPFKEFHIGHLMPNVIGESIARLVEANGAEIKRANYQGDVGLHVAKAVWAMKNGATLAEAYAEGHKAYEENESFKQEIIDINKKIYDKSNETINELYEDGRKKSLLYFEVIYKRLSTKFDFYFFESETASFGKEVVLNNTPNIFEESEGAIVFRGENYDTKLHTRVFINKDGLPTYEAKELGLAQIKYDAYPYSQSIVVTGNEINEYFKVLLKAMSLVFPELSQKTKHVSHGMLKLPSGKMSSRTGDVITAEFLIDQVKEKIKEKIQDEEIVQQIAIGAIKYTILRQAIGGDIIFDIDKSISFDGDSGPYLQYATVRANSLLKKAEGIVGVSTDIPEGWETTNLERYLERFGAVVERAGAEYAPHHIVTYLVELAGEFNVFYASGKIIEGGDHTASYRLALTEAFAKVMIKGLDLLGIKVPSQM